MWYELFIVTVFVCVNRLFAISLVRNLCYCCYSYKFGKKLAYVNRLDELQETLYLDQVDIPQEVKE